LAVSDILLRLNDIVMLAARKATSW